MDTDFLCTQAITDDFDETFVVGEESADESERKQVGLLKVLPNKKTGIPAIEFPIYIGENVVGRHTSSDISIPWSLALSKKHAVLEGEQDGIFVTDCGSSNKTKLGQVKLKPHVKYGLRDEDEVFFGDVKCVVLCQNTSSTADGDAKSHSKSEKLSTTATPKGRAQILARDTPDATTSAPATVHDPLNESTSTIPESQPVTVTTPNSISKAGNSGTKISGFVTSPLPFELCETGSDTEDELLSVSKTMRTTGINTTLVNISMVKDSETDYHMDSDTDVEDATADTEDIYNADTIELKSGDNTQTTTEEVHKYNTGSDEDEYETSMIANLDPEQTQRFSAASTDGASLSSDPKNHLQIEKIPQRSSRDVEVIHSEDSTATQSQSKGSAVEPPSSRIESAVAAEEELPGCSGISAHDQEEDVLSSLEQDSFGDLCTQAFGTRKKEEVLQDTMGSLQTQAFSSRGKREEDDDDGESMLFDMPTQAFPRCLKSPGETSVTSQESLVVPLDEGMPDVGDSITQDESLSDSPATPAEVEDTLRLDACRVVQVSEDTVLPASSTSIHPAPSEEENSGFSEIPRILTEDTSAEDTEPLELSPVLHNGHGPPVREDSSTPILQRSRDATVDACIEVTDPQNLHHGTESPVSNNELEDGLNNATSNEEPTRSHPLQISSENADQRENCNNGENQISDFATSEPLQASVSANSQVSAVKSIFESGDEDDVGTTRCNSNAAGSSAQGSMEDPTFHPCAFSKAVLDSGKDPLGSHSLHVIEGNVKHVRKEGAESEAGEVLVQIDSPSLKQENNSSEGETSDDPSQVDKRQTCAIVSVDDRSETFVPEEIDVGMNDSSIILGKDENENVLKIGLNSIESGLVPNQDENHKTFLSSPNISSKSEEIRKFASNDANIPAPTQSSPCSSHENVREEFSDLSPDHQVMKSSERTLLQEPTKNDVKGKKEDGQLPGTSPHGAAVQGMCSQGTEDRNVESITTSAHTEKQHEISSEGKDNATSRNNVNLQRFASNEHLKIQSSQLDTFVDSKSQDLALQQNLAVEDRGDVENADQPEPFTKSCREGGAAAEESGDDMIPTQAYVKILPRRWNNQKNIHSSDEAGESQALCHQPEEMRHFIKDEMSDDDLIPTQAYVKIHLRKSNQDTNVLSSNRVENLATSDTTLGDSTGSTIRKEHLLKTPTDHLTSLQSFDDDEDTQTYILKSPPLRTSRRTNRKDYASLAKGTSASSQNGSPKNATKEDIGPPSSKKLHKGVEIDGTLTSASMQDQKHDENEEVQTGSSSKTLKKHSKIAATASKKIPKSEKTKRNRRKVARASNLSKRDRSAAASSLSGQENFKESDEMSSGKRKSTRVSRAAMPSEVGDSGVRSALDDQSSVSSTSTNLLKRGGPTAASFVQGQQDAEESGKVFSITRKSTRTSRAAMSSGVENDLVSITLDNQKSVSLTTSNLLKKSDLTAVPPFRGQQNAEESGGEKFSVTRKSVRASGLDKSSKFGDSGASSALDDQSSVSLTSSHLLKDGELAAAYVRGQQNAESDETFSGRRKSLRTSRVTKSSEVGDSAMSSAQDKQRSVSSTSSNLLKVVEPTAASSLPEQQNNKESCKTFSATRKPTRISGVAKSSGVENSAASSLADNQRSVSSASLTKGKLGSSGLEACSSVRVQDKKDEDKSEDLAKVVTKRNRREKPVKKGSQKKPVVGDELNSKTKSSNVSKQLDLHASEETGATYSRRVQSSTKQGASSKNEQSEETPSKRKKLVTDGASSGILDRLTPSKSDDTLASATIEAMGVVGAKTNRKSTDKKTATKRETMKEENDGNELGEKFGDIASPLTSSQGTSGSRSGVRKRRNTSMSSSSSSSKGSSAKKSKSDEVDFETATATRVLRPKREKPKVLFTGVLDTAAEAIVVNLGGKLAANISDCTHLVTDKMRRTVKFLCAVARGLHIVNLQWLHQSSRHSRFLPEEDFELTEGLSSPSGETIEEKYDFQLKRTIQAVRESRNPLFHGLEVFVTKNVAPSPDQMNQILKCAGATILLKMPPSSGQNGSCQQKVIIATPSDKRACVNAIKSGCKVVSNEFVLTGILRHQVDYKSHQLFDSCGDTERGDAVEEAAGPSKETSSSQKQNRTSVKRQSKRSARK